MDTQVLERFGLEIVLGIAGAMLMAWLFTTGQTTLGRRELHYSLRLKWVAVLTFVFGVACAYGGTLTHGTNALWAYGLATVFGLGGVYLILETFTRRVRYDENYLHDRSIWRRSERRVAWRKLSDYGYSDVNQWHIFVAGPMTIRVSALLAGHDEFLSFVERKLTELGMISDDNNE